MGRKQEQMPLYEYECQQCHRRTEKIQRYSAPEITTCPHCAGPLERTITAPAVQFKGAGWYKDLYSSAKPAPASSGDAAAAPAANGDGSSGTKPEAAAPAAAPASAPAPTSSAGTTGS